MTESLCSCWVSISLFILFFKYIFDVLCSKLMNHVCIPDANGLNNASLEQSTIIFVHSMWKVINLKAQLCFPLHFLRKKIGERRNSLNIYEDSFFHCINIRRLNNHFHSLPRYEKWSYIIDIWNVSFKLLYASTLDVVHYTTRACSLLPLMLKVSRNS